MELDTAAGRYVGFGQVLFYVFNKANGLVVDEIIDYSPVFITMRTQQTYMSAEQALAAIHELNKKGFYGE